MVQPSPLRAQARRVKDLTELKLSDLWREVKSDEDWWGDLKGETLRVVKRLLESYMEEELLEHFRRGVGAALSFAAAIVMAIGSVACLRSWA